MTAAKPTRRRFLQATTVTALGAAGGLVTSQQASALTPAPRLVSADGLGPVSMAMHIHASFSEGSGSMESHLRQAANTGIDVIWWSEHDHRMSARDYRKAVHFDGLAERENGKDWVWQPSTEGWLTAKAGRFVTSPASSGSSHAPSSLHLEATGGGVSWASHRYEGQAQNDLIRTSLDGQTIEIDVYPMDTGYNAYLALRLVTSHRPARAGLSAGRYELCYRVGGPAAAGSKSASGRVGTITLAAPRGQWTTLRLNPAADIARLWSGVDGRDASLYKLFVEAVSRRKVIAKGNFDHLRFTRANKWGNAPLNTQAELMGIYAPRFPGVKQRQALELSGLHPHMGWYGGSLSLPSYSSSSSAAALVDLVHDSGGIASYNHPFGTGKTVASSGVQDSRRRELAADLVRNRALGCDLLEVGYRQRGGVDMARHAELWDVCSRNALFLTGTGVSDDHTGTNWLSQRHNFVTWAWAADTSTSALLAALRGGRAYFGDPARFRGQLDLRVGGSAPMGSVTVSSALQRSLRVTATGIPSGGRVEVVRGLADIAGPGSPDPVNDTTAFPKSLFGSGYVDTTVDTSRPRYVRAVVRDASGVVVALSNPVWLLREWPPGGIPAARRA